MFSHAKRSIYIFYMYMVFPFEQTLPDACCICAVPIQGHCRPSQQSPRDSLEHVTCFEPNGTHHNLAVVERYLYEPKPDHCHPPAIIWQWSK